MRYGHLSATCEAFLGSVGSLRSWPYGHLITSRGWAALRLSLSGPGAPLYRFEPAQQPAGTSLPFSVPSQAGAPRWYRNISLLPIIYAFRPRLRYRLTHGRMILPQESFGLRRGGFSPPFSLLIPALSLLRPATASHDTACVCLRMLPYRPPSLALRRARSFGTMLSPVGFSARNRLTSELLRFL